MLATQKPTASERVGGTAWSTLYCMSKEKGEGRQGADRRIKLAISAIVSPWFPKNTR